MNPNDIRRLFPNASQSLLAANAEGAELPRSDKEGKEAKTPKLRATSKRTVRNAALPAAKAEVCDTGRFLVRIERVSKRLADEDGLCPKYIVDCCRYAGIIPEDAPGICKIETTQRKAAKGEEPHTLIEVYAP